MTQALGQNPKDLLGILKVDLSSVPPVSILYEALGMQDGKMKYGAFNWRENKVIASIYYAAAKRHLDAWFDGQENAEDSGYPHLGHAKACIGIVIDALETGNLVDDRPVKGAYAAVLARWNAWMKGRAEARKLQAPVAPTTPA